LILSRHTQRSKSRFLLLLLFLALATTITGCATRAFTGTGWPGVTVGDGVIYLADGPFVYAIDPEDGRLQWRYPEDQGGAGFWSRPALTEDGILVIGDYGNTLHAFRDDGRTYELLWTYTTDGPHFVGGAAIEGDVVYAASVDGQVHALDLATGEPLPGFSFQAERPIWSTPVLVGDVLYVTAMDQRLYALNAATGAEIWRFDTRDYGGGGAIVGTPVYDEGVLYFGAFDNTVYALDAATHDVLWTYDTTNWVWDSLAIADGTLVGADLDGNVFGLDAESGRELWVVTTGGPVVGAPLLADGLAYLTSADHNLYVLNVTTGEEAYRPVEIEVEFTNRFLGLITTGTELRSVLLNTGPVLCDDMVLIAVSQGDQLMVALDRETQALRWRFDPNAE
jgi:outer membrane protein assembly factor BamB